MLKKPKMSPSLAELQDQSLGFADVGTPKKLLYSLIKVIK